MRDDDIFSMFPLEIVQYEVRLIFDNNKFIYL